MAVDQVLVITTPSGTPDVVDSTDPTLVGQVILDYIATQSVPAPFNVAVQAGERRTPDA
jgi:hypothetical protein